MMMTQSHDLGIKKMEMGNSTASHTTTLDITSFFRKLPLSIHEPPSSQVRCCLAKYTAF